MSFSDYKLDPFVLKYLTRQKITEPTDIQAQAIPVALDGTDILAISQTGSGKTLAFALPALTCLDEEEPGRNRMLVLTPTRELAQQVHKVIESIARILELKTVCIFGGVSIDRQSQALKRGVDVIVATPGRLMDHMERGNIDFSALTTLVLDEADRMLDMGFLPDIKRILSELPEGRQTMLFSATFAKDIELLTKQFMYKPKRIEIGRVAPTTKVRQEMYAVDQQKKPLLLQKILRGENVKSTIVFMRTKHRTDRITKTLKNEGFKAQAIHGGRTQGQRKNALDGFRKGQIDVLVATDVAARGIDIQGVTHVINFDIPGAYDDYVHRIGRTARANAEGDAITFVTKEDAKELRIIEKALGKPIPRVEWVGDIDIEKPDRPKKNTKQKSNGERDEEAKSSRRTNSRTERFKRSKNRADGSRRNSEATESGAESRKPKRKKTQTTPKRNNKPSNTKSNKNDSNSTHKPSRGKAGRRGPAKQSPRTANV